MGRGKRDMGFGPRGLGWCRREIELDIMTRGDKGARPA